MGVAIPIVVITTVLTLKSDTTPIKVKVNKPRGTIYWGGAGLDGPYIQPQLDMLIKSGIRHCYVGKTNSATKTIGEAGMFIDAMQAGSSVRYIDDGEWLLTGMDKPSEQFNLIGYSYGSLLAAQTANYYANNGHIVDNLVLIGSPIDLAFLNKLKSNKRIKKIIVINLIEYGDPIYAGISQTDLIMNANVLIEQMVRNKGEGHFYYAHVVPESQKRWESLARRLYNEGLR